MRCDAVTGNVKTVAGSSPSKSQAFADGVGTHARFNGIYLISISSSGKLFISDYGNKRIRVLDTTGLLCTAPKYR
jgi:hypothetical protein